MKGNFNLIENNAKHCKSGCFLAESSQNEGGTVAEITSAREVRLLILWKYSVFFLPPGDTGLWIDDGGGNRHIIGDVQGLFVEPTTTFACRFAGAEIFSWSH